MYSSMRLLATTFCSVFKSFVHCFFLAMPFLDSVINWRFLIPTLATLYFSHKIGTLLMNFTGQLPFVGLKAHIIIFVA